MFNLKKKTKVIYDVSSAGQATICLRYVAPSGPVPSAPFCLKWGCRVFDVSVFFPCGPIQPHRHIGWPEEGCCFHFYLMFDFDPLQLWFNMIAPCCCYYGQWLVGRGAWYAAMLASYCIYLQKRLRDHAVSGFTHII